MESYDEQGSRQKLRLRVPFVFVIFVSIGHVQIKNFDSYFTTACLTGQRIAGSSCHCYDRTYQIPTRVSQKCKITDRTHTLWFHSILRHRCFYFIVGRTVAI